jgi:hypothetical protein
MGKMMVMTIVMIEKTMHALSLSLSRDIRDVRGYLMRLSFFFYSPFFCYIRVKTAKAYMAWPTSRPRPPLTPLIRCC